jgi:hypothetical protein
MDTSDAEAKQHTATLAARYMLCGLRDNPAPYVRATAYSVLPGCEPAVEAGLRPDGRSVLRPRQPSRSQRCAISGASPSASSPARWPPGRR